MNAHSDVYKAALIVIGNEILSGRTQDSNIQWIAQKLIGKGIVLAEIRVVPDIEEKIVRAVNGLRAEVDYVFTTGGIGPTHDDITAASVAKAFGARLAVDPQARKVMEDHYGADNLTPARLKMAMIPEGASLIPNPVSGAPGFIMGNVHVMAGVPRIMQAMLENILPILKEGAQVFINTVACGLQESVIAERLTDLQNRYPEVDIGSYPTYRSGPQGLSVVLKSIHEEKVRAATAEFMEIARSFGAEPVAMGLQAPPEGLGGD